MTSASSFSSLVAILLSPAVVTFVWNPGFLYPRYFLVSLTLGLVVLALGLAAVWRSGTAGRRACGLVLRAMVLGNAWQVGEWLQYGPATAESFLPGGLSLLARGEPGGWAAHRWRASPCWGARESFANSHQ